MKTKSSLIGLIVCTSLSWTTSARADAVIDWDAITVEAILAAGPARPGGTGFLDFTMAHLAMYDAVQAYEHRYEPYCATISGATGSPVTAVATAAHDVLVHQFPAQAGSLDAAYDNYLNANGLASDVDGVLVGHAVANALLDCRAGDGSFPASYPAFLGGTEPGQWRPTLPAFAPMAAPWLGSVTPFALKSSDQLRPAPGPPSLTSGEYTLAYNEVNALGRKDSTVRTPEQTAMALFWSGNFLAIWAPGLRAIAAANLTDMADTARMFALIGVASADAVISSWDAKLYYNFWRPITAIQEGDNDGNPHTGGDPTWMPYINTPPYPDYTSGANNVTSAITRILALLFGDRMTYTLTAHVVDPLAPPTVPPTFVDVSRTFTSFSSAEDEVVVVRIYQGIHFRFADTVARRQGKRSADWAFSHVMRPATP